MAQQTTQIAVRADAGVIQTMLEEINRFNATPEEGTTRILFTEQELASRVYIKEKMRELELDVTEDAAGNIFGTLPGTEPALAPVWTGSHIDTVPNAGMFDGMAGIVSGLEALRLIRESGIRPRRNISVIVYLSEEPTRFGLSCLGSRMMAGCLSEEETKQLKDAKGNSLWEMLKKTGHDVTKLGEVRRKKGEVAAAVELHIEQNNVLDQNKIPVGIVRGICAPTIFTVHITGKQSHAGGTPMGERKDAYAAASELTLAAERFAKASTGEYLTATVGRVEVFPNAVNVISGDVKMSVDIRSIDMESKEEFITKLKNEAEAISARRGVEITFHTENHDTPLRCDARLISLLREKSAELEIPAMELISGAYHDSLFVGRFAPVGMIFVPSKNGISHSKEEWTEFSDLALGTDVLAHTLLALANE